LAAALFVLGTLTEASPAGKEPSRPHIYGIAQACIHSAHLESSILFYRNSLGLVPAGEVCKGTNLTCFQINGLQILQLDPVVTPLPNNFLEEIGFLTDDVSAMRKFLVSRGLRPSSIDGTGKFSSSVSVNDPEGHRISFIAGPGIVEPVIKDVQNSQRNRVGVADRKMIHAGFVVHDRAAMDKFYKDILGFHVYWHGGMKEDETNWVDMQVPDGTDWIEYMLNVPANADKHTLGVMNHIALGVPDIHAAAKQLLTNGMKPAEEPKIGRDGKWQLNLYDPDDTRVELMEFTPVEKPCCSAYTGPHPKP
jgi:catechol 2,3-dioxygenase-like lactoylglutathione lyase family enzyme